MEWMILKQMNLHQNEFNNKDTYIFDNFFILETSFHNSNQTVNSKQMPYLKYADAEKMLITTLNF